MTEPSARPMQMQIFRKADAPQFSESGLMSYADVSATAADGLKRMWDAGLEKGLDLRLLFECIGMSPSYAKFKHGYPLPLHTHNVDCLYFILSGSIRLGTEMLGAGDGFFVPADVPYTYKPNEEGVEILEFRNQSPFNIRFMANKAPAWDKAVDAVRENVAAWSDTP